MMQLEQTKLDEVVQQAFDDAEAKGGKAARRWTTAIAKAKGQLEANPFLHYEGDSLLILSDSLNIYRANGVCQCTAYAKHQPCWHRAAYKIVKRYMERGN